LKQEGAAAYGPLLLFHQYYYAVFLNAESAENAENSEQGDIGIVE